MDLRKVKKLIELFEESQLVEMEISEGESVIRLSRGSQPQGIQYIHGAAEYPGSQSAPGSPEVPEPETIPAIAGHTVTSPMVGTYYDTSSPDSEPYVKVGSSVEVGDVLCIIEAMKTFNHIESEVSGIVRAINKHSGEPVEYAEPLFVIE